MPSIINIASDIALKIVCLPKNATTQHTQKHEREKKHVKRVGDESVQKKWSLRFANTRRLGQ